MEEAKIIARQYAFMIVITILGVWCWWLSSTCIKLKQTNETLDARVLKLEEASVEQLKYDQAIINYLTSRKSSTLSW